MGLLFGRWSASAGGVSEVSSPGGYARRILNDNGANKKMIVEAGLTGDRDLAFVNDPLVGHSSDAGSMFGEMFEAHSGYLARFEEVPNLKAGSR